MKCFEHFNKTTNCPVCGKNKDGKAVLIPIMDKVTGNIAECKQIHLDCIDLTWQAYKEGEGIIFQVIEEKI